MPLSLEYTETNSALVNTNLSQALVLCIYEKKTAQQKSCKFYVEQF